MASNFWIDKKFRLVINKHSTCIAVAQSHYNLIHVYQTIVLDSMYEQYARQGNTRQFCPHGNIPITDKTIVIHFPVEDKTGFIRRIQGPENNPVL